MEELQLHLHGAHGTDHEKPGEHSRQVRETYHDCFINEYVIGKVLYIQPLIRT